MKKQRIYSLNQAGCKVSANCLNHGLHNLQVISKLLKGERVMSHFYISLLIPYICFKFQPFQDFQFHLYCKPNFHSFVVF